MTRNLFIAAAVFGALTLLLFANGFSSASVLTIAASAFCTAPAAIFITGIAIGRGSLAAEKVVQDAQRYREAVNQGKVRRVPTPNQELIS